MKDTDSPFSPASILKASGNRFRSADARWLDRAQGGARPSDFGDHAPILDEAVVQVEMGEAAKERKIRCELLNILLNKKE